MPLQKDPRHPCLSLKNRSAADNTQKVSVLNKDRPPYLLTNAPAVRIRTVSNTETAT